MALTRVRSHQLGNFDYKDSVRVATTASVTLSGGAPLIVDGVTLVKGNRVLVWKQGTASQNGIYEVVTVGTGSNGTWSRAVDANTSTKVNSGMTTRVEEGNTYADVLFVLTTNDPITLDTTSLTFSSSIIGTNGQVLYNDNGSSAGNANLTFNGTTLSASALYVTTDAVIDGNLTVNGQTTTINSTTTTIDDKNIVLASGAADGAAADGAGITIDGASASLTYVNSSNSWAFDRKLGANGTITATQLVSNVSTGTAPLTVTSTTQVANLNVAVAGTVSSASQSNITSVGTLTGLDVNAQINATAFSSNISTGTAPFTVSSTTRVANLNVAAAGVANTVVDAAQPNITSLGTLTALNVNAQTNATIFSSNIATGTAPLVVASTTRVANLNVATAGNLINGNSNVVVVANANVNISSTGNANVFVVTGVGANVNGDLSITGTVTGGSIKTTSSSSAPSSPTVGDMWYNTTTDVLYRRTSDGTTSFWLDVGGPASYSLNALSLIGDTLSTSVLNSSLTSVGTLTGLTTSGAASITYTPSTATGFGVTITGKDTQGGTGYFDFLKATNTTSGVTNGSKIFRLNNAGNVEIVNSDYTATIAAVTNGGNLVLAGYVQPGAYTAGQVIKDTMLDNSQFTVPATTVATSTSDTDFISYSYTPVSSSSYLIIHVHVGRYDAATSAGSGTDSYFSRIKVDGSEIVYGWQYTRDTYTHRSGTLFPLIGRYTNSNTTAKTITVGVRRDSADDSITITNSATALWMRITEVAR